MRAAEAWSQRTPASSNVERLSQYQTPRWAALELYAKYFGDLPAGSPVVEPSCGTGAFLDAIPRDLPAIGVEIDPDLARVAERCTGRRVIVGDFRMVDLPFTPVALVGNPPFRKAIVDAFLERAWTLLPEEGRVGFILPAFILQTASTIDSLSERWSVRQDMLPRDLYPRLKHPLCFAVLTKGRERGLVGFSLYHELAAIRRLKTRYEELLAAGEGSVWAATVRAALEQLGRTATLRQLYNEIEGHRPTANMWWKEKVRQVLRSVAHRVDDGVWSLDPLPVAA